jgi:hypothetical protein
VRLWDATYAQRAHNCGVFLVCQPAFLELWRPPILRQPDMRRIIGRVPGTQNPPQITSGDLRRLVEFAHQDAEP